MSPNLIQPELILRVCVMFDFYNEVIKKDAGVSLTGVLELQRLLYNIHLIKKTDMIYINLSFKSTLCLICSESTEPCE